MYLSRNDWAICKQQVGLFKAISEEAAGGGPREGEGGEIGWGEARDASPDTYRSGYLL